jgi:hypothetical protein
LDHLGSVPHPICLVPARVRFRQRNDNHNFLNKVYHVRVLDQRGFCAGYIYTPDPDLMSAEDRLQYYGGSGSGSGSHGRHRYREFVVLSRASTNRDPREGSELLETTPIEELSSVYSMAHMVGGLARLRPAADDASDRDSNSDDNEELGEEGGEEDEEQISYNDPVAHFDTRLYDATTPWGLFNVMMIERSSGGIARRVAVGRIQVAAFMEGRQVGERYVELC